MNVALNYQEIEQYYLERSQAIVARHINPVVLKTDLYNEAQGFPIPGGIAGNIQCRGVIGIEIDPETVRVAKENLKDNHLALCDQGDIRSLLEAYSDYFDVILDLSTLDHVWPEEVPTVISEYNRVLMPGGTILLIVWLDRDNDHTEHSLGKYQQNMIGLNQIKQEIGKYFRIEEERNIFSDPKDPNQSLIEFTLKK